MQSSIQHMCLFSFCAGKRVLYTESRLKNDFGNMDGIFGAMSALHGEKLNLFPNFYLFSPFSHKLTLVITKPFYISTYFCV